MASSTIAHGCSISISSRPQTIPTGPTSLINWLRVNNHLTMTAMQAIDDIERQQKQALSYDFAGKMSNQFIAELKSSSLFQLNWSELLSTASISQSLTGTCWIAAAQPSADRIRLETAAPADGFKYLTNRRSPTLRTSLVDACNNGGRMAIALASKNMDALRIRSQRVSNEMVRQHATLCENLVYLHL